MFSLDEGEYTSVSGDVCEGMTLLQAGIILTCDSYVMIMSSTDFNVISSTHLQCTHAQEHVLKFNLLHGHLLVSEVQLVMWSCVDLWLAIL
jgi:hypothetical protein